MESRHIYASYEHFPPHHVLQFSSVQSLRRVRLLATPWIAAYQASLFITNSQSSLWLTSIESVMPTSHLTLCHRLLLLPPIPPSIRVFSNESTLRIRWLKYWSFSFSIISPKEHQPCLYPLVNTLPPSTYSLQIFSILFLNVQFIQTIESKWVRHNHCQQRVSFKNNLSDLEKKIFWEFKTRSNKIYYKEIAKTMFTICRLFSILYCKAISLT